MFATAERLARLGCGRSHKAALVYETTVLEKPASPKGTEAANNSIRTRFEKRNARTEQNPHSITHGFGHSYALDKISQNTATYLDSNYSCFNRLTEVDTDADVCSMTKTRKTRQTPFGKNAYQTSTAK